MNTITATPTIESNTVPFGMNQELHEKAINLVLKLNADAKVLAAKGVMKDYNSRRKAATAELRVILTEIWEKFDQGEMVGTYTGKKDWCAGVGLGYRWAAKVVAGGREKKVNSVHLPKVGGTLTLFGKRYVVLRLPSIEDEIRLCAHEVKSNEVSHEITIGLQLIGEALRSSKKEIEPVLEVGRTYFVRWGSRNDLREAVYEGPEGDKYIFILKGERSEDCDRVLKKNAPKVWELDEQGKKKPVKIPNKFVLVRKVTQ